MALSSLILSLDSGICGVVLGAGGVRTRLRLAVPLAFGLCDAAATLLGGALPPLGLHLGASPLFFLGCALCARLARTQRAVLYALPVLCSLDNLLTGGTSLDAVSEGAVSAGLALIGLTVGALGRERVLSNSSPVTHARLGWIERPVGIGKTARTHHCSSYMDSPKQFVRERCWTISWQPPFGTGALNRRSESAAHQLQQLRPRVEIMAASS